MAGDITSKLKVVYIMKMLLENTDEEHPMTMQDILDTLNEYGISAERKSVYNDIEQLILFGLDIIKERTDKSFVYYIGRRRFETAELKLLVDSVQSARFITEKKSNELIKKIEALTCKYEATKLQRQVFVTERVKSDNEQILYNIDALHNAVTSNSRITFKYFNWNVKKKAELRHDGREYIMSPWALTLSDENYYLVAYDEERDGIRYFRVDKMLNIELTGEPRKGLAKFQRFDIAAYAKKRFHMYDGDERTVKLVCDNRMAGVIIDRFGKDIMIHPVDENHFSVNVEVAVSDQFFGWVASMCEGIRIEGPADVVERMKGTVERLCSQYCGEK